MKTTTTTPVVRLVRETNNLLNRGEISPECAFRMTSFAADGSEEPDAWAQLARYYRNGIGCKRDEGMALYALRKSGKADWLLTPEDEPALGPEFGGCLMDEDEMYIERRDEDDLVDDFLDWDGNTVLAQYAEYDTANLGCSPDHPFVIPMPANPEHLFEDDEELLLERVLRPIPYRYVDYEVAEQKTLNLDGRTIDHIRVRVSTHPLLTEDQDGYLYLPDRQFLGYEDYWFEIPLREKLKRLEELDDIDESTLLV